MTIIPIPGAGSYCIDAVEVTYADYKLFINSNPNIGNQPSFCSWNATYIPSADWPRPPAEESLPVTSIDWCDAYAFCRASNKHLCGKMGGGATPIGSYVTAAQDEWYNACSAQGVNVYPYGASYNPTKCRGDGAPSATSYHATCLGGLPGLYDMSGNVWEWEDACSETVGATDVCRIRGGSFRSSPDLLMCGADSISMGVQIADGGLAEGGSPEAGDAGSPEDGDGGQITITRATTANDIGFRCCQ
jgi:formylglycine-generating enzyme required for sulfatase activity